MQSPLLESKVLLAHPSTSASSVHRLHQSVTMSLSSNFDPVVIAQGLCHFEVKLKINTDIVGI